MQHPDILNTLRDAQLAHKAGDFINALNFYEFFFNHALDDDPYALYGVRLSYCLDGWGELALIFPGAKQRLEQKQNELLNHYLSQKNVEVFHDYYCVSKVLNKHKEALNTFCELFSTQPKSAERLVKYVWDDLIVAKKWQVCSDLLTQPSQKIDELFAIYDEAQKLKLSNASFDKVEFEHHLINTLLNGVSSIVQTIRHTNRVKEINALERQFHQIVDSRNEHALSRTVHAQASFLFVGH